MKKILIALALTLGFVAFGAGVAQAHTTPQASKSSIVVTNWKTSLAKGVTNPVNADDVTWDQSYVASVPACHDYWIQEDFWVKDIHSQDEILRIINSGILKKGADDWFQVPAPNGWKFIPPVPCTTPTPTPTKSTPVPTPTPTPTVTTPTPTPVQTTPAQQQSIIPPAEHTTQPGPTLTPVADTTPMLPNTGLTINPFYLVALAALLLLAGLPLANKKRKAPREH